MTNQKKQLLEESIEEDPYDVYKRERDRMEERAKKPWLECFDLVHANTEEDEGAV